MMKPRMFIGSSVEGKDIAEHIQLGLDHDVETTIWHQGMFGLSHGSLESLVSTAKDFDFAALVLTPDDLVMKRGSEKGSPRDNVIFELGLFMGALGRERTFIIYNRDEKPDLPSDLAGITSATFANRRDNNLQAAVGTACTQIKLAIKAFGVRASHSAEAEAIAPATKSEPSTVVVDRQDKGDYATITEALKAVEPGSRILVRPGIYSESIVIDKPVEIIGHGDRNEIVIHTYGKDVILFQADNGKITNLTIRLSGGSGRGVNIAKGRLDLEDCDISSKELICISIQDSADPRLRRNHIHDSAGTGIFIYNNGQGMLEDNEICANKGSGVAISKGGNPTLRRNRITQNNREGIRVYEGGGGIFENNDLRGNKMGAWEIGPACEARVQRRGNKE